TDEMAGDVFDSTDASVFRQMTDKGAFDIVNGWGIVVFSRHFQTNQNRFFKLSHALPCNTKQFADLFQRFTTIKQTEPTGDNLLLAILLDDTQNVSYCV